MTDTVLGPGNIAELEGTDLLDKGRMGLSLGALTNVGAQRPGCQPLPPVPAPGWMGRPSPAAPPLTRPVSIVAHKPIHASEILNNGGSEKMPISSHKPDRKHLCLQNWEPYPWIQIGRPRLSDAHLLTYAHQDLPVLPLTFPI